jgi:hypothetical protein
MRLIRLPLKVAPAIPKSVAAALAPDNELRKNRAPTSISGLFSIESAFQSVG